MSKSLVGAVVVLFHPDRERLRQLHDCLQSQVDLLWFIDNTPGSTSSAFEPNETEPPWTMSYRALGSNLGIAAAQNLGITEAITQGCSHVLLLDQDSLLPEDTVAKLLQAERHLLSRQVKLAAVGPLFIDTKTNLPGRLHHHRWFYLDKPFVDLEAKEPLETDWLIASGSLVRSCVFAEIGLMRPELFIDAVDMEWGLRARSQGFRSFIVPTAQISHSIGDSFLRFMGVSVIVHSDVRTYYITRNWLYLLRIRSMGWRWRSGALLHLAKYIFVHAWLARHVGGRRKVFRRGLWDGLVGAMGPYRP